MMNDLLLLWLAALTLMGSPGPATLSLAAIGTAYGFRRGIPYLIGIMAGTWGVLLLIATGITAIIMTQPVLMRVVTTAAAAYILYLAWRIATAPVGVKAVASDMAPAALPGFLLAIANPKAFAAIGAAYAGHTLVETNLLADTLAKVAALTVMVIIVNVGWLGFGAAFSRVLSHPILGRIANITFAIALVSSVGVALLS